MIIWLASYPKSGNTLLRSILGAYFFSDDGEFKFDHTYKIGQFPTLEYFKRAGINILDDEEIFKNYIKVQKLFNQENKSVKFFKTHSAYFERKNEAVSFSNPENTLGAIYIVRDPRNVVTSYAYHYSIDVKEAANKICNKDLFNIKTDIHPETFLSSWRLNYLSWKRKDIKVILIKYEDLIDNKKKVLMDIFKFFQTLGMKKESFNISKLNKIIKATEFKKMKDLEKRTEFRESIEDPKTKEKKAFFNLGPKNNWRNNLSEDIRKKIEKEFEKEMLELGYL